MVKYGIWQKIRDIPSEIKYFIQRGRRGYSDRDIWGLDSYLVSIIYNGIKKLHDVGMHEFHTSIEFKQMVEGFGLLKDYADEKIYYGGFMETKKKRNMEKHMRIGPFFKDYKFTTRKEEKKISRAFKLFEKNFFQTMGLNEKST